MPNRDDLRAVLTKYLEATDYMGETPKVALKLISEHGLDRAREVVRRLVAECAAQETIDGDEVAQMWRMVLDHIEQIQN